MKRYIKKATIRRNLKFLCDFIHKEIEYTGLDALKTHIKKDTKQNISFRNEYIVLIRFVRNSKNMDGFESFYKNLWHYQHLYLKSV